MCVFPFQGGEQARIRSRGTASTQLLLRRGQLTAPRPPWPPWEQTRGHSKASPVRGFREFPPASAARGAGLVWSTPVTIVPKACPRTHPPQSSPSRESPGRRTAGSEGPGKDPCVSCLRGVISCQVTFRICFCIGRSGSLEASCVPFSAARGAAGLAVCGGGKGSRGELAASRTWLRPVERWKESCHRKAALVTQVLCG